MTVVYAHRYTPQQERERAREEDRTPGTIPARHCRVPVGEYSPGAFGFVIDPERHDQVESSALEAST